MVALAQRNYDLTGPGVAQHVNGMEVSSGLFTALGVNLALGRDLSPSEDRPHGSPAVLISDRLWKDRFGSNPRALGSTIILDGVETPVVGILPPKFHIWIDTDVFTPLWQGDPLVYNDRTVHSIVCIARLKPA